VFDGTICRLVVACMDGCCSGDRCCHVVVCWVGTWSSVVVGCVRGGVGGWGGGCVGLLSYVASAFAIVTAIGFYKAHQVFSQRLVLYLLISALVYSGSLVVVCSLVVSEHTRTVQDTSIFPVVCWVVEDAIHQLDHILLVCAC